MNRNKFSFFELIGMFLFNLFPYIGNRIFKLGYEEYTRSNLYKVRQEILQANHSMKECMDYYFANNSMIDYHLVAWKKHWFRIIFDPRPVIAHADLLLAKRCSL